MKRKSRKRLILIPFVALAAVLAFAATAFACTIWEGTFTVAGNSSTTSVTATGTGMMTQTVSAGIAKASATNGSITVSTGIGGGGQLPANTTYEIRFYNSVYPTAPGYTDHTHWKTDCMAGSSGTQLGSDVTVGSNGTITGQPVTRSLPTGTLTADQAPAESAVCISDSTGSYGNEAPLTIL